MITLSQFVSLIKKKFPAAELKFRYPTLYLVCCDQSLAGIPSEDREAFFFQKHEIPTSDVRTAIQAGGVQFVLCTPEERTIDFGFLDAPGATSHWAEFLADSNAQPRQSADTPSRFIHFYGYKGGQARSSVLAMLAKNLASDGYRVLTVDADLEAPSLHTLFRFPSPQPSASLLGCALHGLEPTPQSVFFPARGKGRIDLLACRPSDHVYDLDAANFALHAALDPSMVADVIRKVAQQQAWDVILVDHRTGLAPSVLPIVVNFPGPVIACLRLDEQSTHAAPYFSALFRQHPTAPGLLLSFSLNPKDNRSAMFEGQLKEIEQSLQPLADALSSIPDADFEPTAPEEIHDYWVPWFHDGAFLSPHLPEVSHLRHDNQQALQSIRTLLGLQTIQPLSFVSASPEVVSPLAGQLTGSGNSDTGTLIQNEALRKLRPPTTPFTYIVGRKGTGKTRLLRALAEEKKGEPILVADDYPHLEGIKSSDTLIGDLAGLFEHDPTKFWWVLLDVSLNSTERTKQEAALQQILTQVTEKGISAFTLTKVKERILALPQSKVFLIDGVETAFNSSRIIAFVEGLFRCLAAVQSDLSISQKITIRLFIRTDLVDGASENIEQQTENRKLLLAWNTQSILNFVLARIAALEWFKEHFSDVVRDIQDRASDITQGNLSEEHCADILRRVFPEKVRRHNVLILTFLTTYFSDGQGDKASFYPRVYDSFLRFIADGGPQRTGTHFQQLENGRVAQDIIADAHVHACRSYLDQVKDELKNLVDLGGDNLEQNAQRISDLLEKFNNKPTPFHLDKMINDLAAATGQSESVLRRALQQMKRVGIFEERPGYSDHWRAGRLFKSSLGMRYNRRRRGEQIDE